MPAKVEIVEGVVDGEKEDGFRVPGDGGNVGVSGFCASAGCARLHKNEVENIDVSTAKGE